MKTNLLLICSLKTIQLSAQSYKEIHKNAILVDTHNDFISQPMERNMIFDSDLNGKMGVDYVGIGTDFDGIFLPPKQLDDVTDYPLITQTLVENGYSEKDIDKILGGNILRVLKANEND